MENINTYLFEKLKLSSAKISTNNFEADIQYKTLFSKQELSLIEDFVSNLTTKVPPYKITNYYYFADRHFRTYYENSIYIYFGEEDRVLNTYIKINKDDIDNYIEGVIVSANRVEKSTIQNNLRNVFNDIEPVIDKYLY